mgnify:FL=1
MHQAHKRIGVPAAAFHPYAPADGAIENTVRVRMVSDPRDRFASDALDAFEPIVARQGHLEYERAEFRAAFQSECVGVDCAVVFARGIHVLARGVDFEPDGVMEDGGDGAGEAAVPERIVPAAPWHPVLDRICSFEAHPPSRRFAAIPRSAIGLLIAKHGTAEVGGRFVAWANESPNRQFHTLLCSPDDFRQPDFVQLMLNAVEWAGG